MNSRRVMNARLGCLLFLIGLVLGTMPAALRAAVPPAAATADDISNPYAVIVERNVFHLNPPPPPPEPEKPKVELPVVKITGFVDIGSQSKALFVSQPKDKKETAYYSLSEGEESSDGKLKLLKIHDAKDAVDVLNVGMPVTLTVKDDSLGQTAEPAAPETKGGPPAINPNSGMAGRPMFRPGRSVAPGVPGMPGVPGANGFSLPSRARHNLPAPP